MKDLIPNLSREIKKNKKIIFLSVAICVGLLVFVLQLNKSYHQTNSSGPERTFAESSWKVISSPNNSSNSHTLKSIAGVAANDIWAVGSYFPTTGGSQTLIQRWDGSQWNSVTSPN